MDKIYEKKNLGIPVTLLVLLAYLIGYSLTRTISGTMLVAIVFAGVVFSLQFDERVKNAVKHSYIFAVLIQLVYFLFELFKTFISLISGGRAANINVWDAYYDYNFNFIHRGLSYLYTYGLILVDLAVVIIFTLLIFMAILKKDVNIGFVASILGDTPQKPKNQPPTYNQPPVPPMAPRNQAPMAPQAPVVPPQAPSAPPAAAPQSANAGCPNCGNINANDAMFCASCGTKLK